MGVKRAGSLHILLVLSHQSQEHKMTTSPCVKPIVSAVLYIALNSVPRNGNWLSRIRFLEILGSAPSKSPHRFT